VISKGERELLIVFRDTNACLISANAIGLSGEKQQNSTQCSSWILKKRQRGEITEVKIQYSTK